MKSSFAGKLTASYLFVAAVTLLFTGAFLAPRIQRAFLKALEDSLASQASLIARTLSARMPAASLRHSLQAQALEFGRQTGCRVTIIRRDGVVVGDSQRTLAELARMDNHLRRPEIREALAAGRGHSQRHSATLDENMLYVAVAIPSSGVLRVALPLTEVHRRIAALRKNFATAGGAALLVAWAVALFSVKLITRPLERLIRMTEAIGQGRSLPAPQAGPRDEFGRLAQTLADMAARVDEKVCELSRERTQLGAILSALIEGVIALDHEGKILFLNPAAERLFGVRSQEARARPALETLRHSPLSEVLRRTLETRQAVAQEIRVHCPDEHILSVQTVPVNYGE